VDLVDLENGDKKMMEELEIEEGRTVKRLSAFLPADLRVKILSAVKELYKNEDGNMFEREAGVNLRDVKKEDAIDKYFPKILAFALTNFPQVKEVIRKDFLEEIESLCEDLDLSGEGKSRGTGRERNNLERFMEHIDGKSREIILYLLRNGHVGIREIRELRDLEHETDMEVLIRIREVINPAAKKFLGKEILEFKQSKIDESSGRNVQFKWWLRDDFQLIENREEILDVFDEPDQIRIIAELPPTIEEKDIKVEVNNNGDILRIIANSPNGRYEKKIPLFYTVEKSMEKTYKNRILGVRLIKKKKRREANGAEKR